MRSRETGNQQGKREGVWYSADQGNRPMTDCAYAKRGLAATLLLACAWCGGRTGLDVDDDADASFLEPAPSADASRDAGVVDGAGEATSDAAAYEGSNNPDGSAADGELDASVDAASDRAASDAGSVTDGEYDGTVGPESDAGDDALDGAWESSSDASSAPHCGGPAVDGGPLVIASGQANPLSLALDSTNLYWGALSSSGPIMQMAMPWGAQPGTPTPIAVGEYYPFSVIVDATHVYWSDALGHIKRVPIGGGTAEILATLSTNVTYWLAIVGTTIFVGGDALYSLSKGGGPVTTIASNQYQVWGMTQDATNLYWTTEALNGAVQKWPLEGGVVTPLASSLVDPFSVAVNSEGVVLFTKPSEGTIESVPVGGGMVSTLLTQQYNADSLLFDCGNLYWSTATSIVRSPASGGMATTIASGMNYPGSIVADDSFIYWADELDGKVMRAPK
jgi:hypothetical protein